jgi:hypothetical protein
MVITSAAGRPLHWRRRPNSAPKKGSRHSPNNLLDVYAFHMVVLDFRHTLRNYAQDVNARPKLAWRMPNGQPTAALALFLGCNSLVMHHIHLLDLVLLHSFMGPMELGFVRLSDIEQDKGT